MPEGFEGLEVWQKAHALMLFVHEQIVPRFPSEEKWDLASQIRRSAKSVAANLAEGYGRFYYLDNCRFCYNARGSLAETVNHLIAARDLKYIDEALYAEGRRLADSVYRLIHGYIAFLKQRKVGADEPGVNLAIRELTAVYEPGLHDPSINSTTQLPVDQLTNYQLTN